MFYKLLADAVIALHLGYVAFVVVGQLLILLGWAVGWRWTRNLRFRITHLVMLEVVALEGLFGIVCPMTHWEDHLRAWARGETFTPYQASAYYGLLEVPGKLTDHLLSSSIPAPAMPGGAAPDRVPTSQLPAPMQEAPPMLPQPEPPAPIVEKQPDPPVPEAVMPAPPKQVEPVTKADPPADSTFVGRLLDSILFLDMPQRVLDWFYVGIGILSLGVFVDYPPERARWSLLGLTGLILLWIGAMFTIFIWLYFGLSLLVAGASCRWASRRFAI